MIQIHYQSNYNRLWIHWTRLGDYDNIHEAINALNALNAFPYSFNAANSQVSMRYSLLNPLNIKFFDTKLKNYVPIESPWKIGLNHDSNSLSK